MNNIKYPGVYKILNVTNGRAYIGSSKNVHHRIIEHKSKLNTNKHANKHLQSAYNKYGPNSFVFQIILICDMNSLLYYEQCIIDKLKPHYNIAKYALSPMKGRKHTEKTKELMRSHHTSETKYPGFEYSWSHPHNKNKSTSQEIKNKISKSLLGHKFTKERNDKIGKAHEGLTPYYKKLRGILISPDNIEYKDIENLNKFSKKYNIDKRRLSEFYLGKRTQWNGWRIICGV